MSASEQPGRKASLQTLWVLPDQLMEDHPGLQPGRWRETVILMVESRRRAERTRAHQVRLAMEWAAMRHYAEWLRAHGWRVDYHPFTSTASYEEGLRRHKALWGGERVEVMEPADWATRQGVPEMVRRVGLELVWLPNNQFLTTPAEFNEWARGRTVFKMESFYRSARRRAAILVEPDGSPVGGSWSFPRAERMAWRAWHLAGDSYPEPFAPPHDALTAQVVAEVLSHFPGHPGDARALWLPVTRKAALVWLRDFVAMRFSGFLRWRQIMVHEPDIGVHSVLAPLLHLGLLRPMECLEAVCSAWERGAVTLMKAEHWAWLLLGYREFMQGIYRTRMPGYGGLNALDAQEPLPAAFLTGESEMRCLRAVVAQLHATGYLPATQRLNILGNLLLLLGVRPGEAVRWFQSMLVDGYEPLLVPNVLGSALFADGGLVVPRPCAVTGADIHQTSNYCAGCRYQPGLRVGEGACPINLLFWSFWDRHLERFEGNPLMAAMLRGWASRTKAERQGILRQADVCRAQFAGGNL